MRRLFDPENPIISTLNDLTDLVILGLLWMICCIPVVTIGASCTAFCYAYNKFFVKKEGHAAKLFFHAFAANFKQATILWLIMVGILAFLGADYYLSRAALEEMPFLSVPLVLVIAIFIFVIMWSQYVFAYLARFENNTKNIMINSALIMLVNFPWSFLLLALFTVAVLFFPLILFVAAILYMVVANKIHERVFSKYIKRVEEGVSEDADL